MNTLSPAPFTGAHLAAFCLKMPGQPYWFGTCLYPATQALLAQKQAQYPQEYAAARTPRYLRDIENMAVCADCIGAVKGYMWTRGGKGVLESIGTGQRISMDYAQYGCPDLTSDGMYQYARQKGARWGEIASFPDVPGIALGKSGHTAVYAGNGEAVEWRSFHTGCVRTRVSARDFAYWYAFPFIRYPEFP